MSTPTAPPSGTPAKRRRFTRAQRWILRILLLLCVVVLGALALLFLAEGRMDDTGTLPSLGGGDVFLVVGTDSREHLPDDLEGNFGDFSGSRADVVMLVQVTNGRRQIVSLPRDLKVSIAGHGTNRINAAYAFGGADLLAETVANTTGIRPGHYLEVGFGGFAAIVDALGGIELTFAHPSRDLKSGLDVPAGTQTVDGATALAYVRSRSLEEYRDGAWRGQGGGDIARTGRQRDVLLQIMDKVGSPAGIVNAPRAALQAASYLTADSSTGIADLVRFGITMQTATTTEAVALPVRNATEGGVAYVVAVEPDAGDLLSAFKAGRPLPD